MNISLWVLRGDLLRDHHWKPATRPPWSSRPVSVGWLEKQLGLIEKIGLENYLQSAI